MRPFPLVEGIFSVYMHVLINCICRVGMIFLPNEDKLAAEAKQIVEDVVKTEGRCKIVGWRDVPVDRDVVARMAKITEPRICQVEHAVLPLQLCRLHQPMHACSICLMLACMQHAHCCLGLVESASGRIS